MICVSEYMLEESKHVYEQRETREDFIKCKVGLGTVILEGPDDKNPNNDYLLTSTGVYIVKPRKKNLVVTLFVVSEARARALFRQNCMKITDNYLKIVRESNEIQREYMRRNNLAHM